MGERRVAMITDAADYVGPGLARLLAPTHDLVLGDAGPELVAELSSLGSDVATIDGCRDLGAPGAVDRLVDGALDRFGRLDAAAAFTGAIVVGRFLRSEVEDLRRVFDGCVEAPYVFLRRVVPTMIDGGGGQVLLFTSAAGARPTPGAPLYSTARAAANMLVRNVADEVVERNVQINSIGTNFMDFPGFLRANRAEEADGRARVEAQVPMGRLGTMEELAHAALPFVDGTSRFATGQFLGVAGGWV